MPLDTLEGLHEASGEIGFPLYATGRYLVEVNRYRIDSKPNMKGYLFWTTIIEGPDQEDGEAPDGKGYFFSQWIPDEDHQNYNDSWRKRSVNYVKAVINATGLKVTSSDKINWDDIVGSKMFIDVGIYKPKATDEKPNPVAQNSENGFFPEEE